jgi:predicted glycosyltransferase
VYYTGYVAQSPQPRSPIERSLLPEDLAAFHQHKPTIIVSAGGGRFGYSLLNAVVNASATLNQAIPHHIYAFTGPLMPAEHVCKLQQAAQHKPNLTLRQYTPHLIDYMAQAELSISLGGYNTTMNILRTGVRSLIFPSAAEEQTGEQTIRAKKLAEKGVLALLAEDDLEGDRLAHRVQMALQQQPVAHSFNLQGAEQSADRLKALLYDQLVTV